MDFLPPSSPKMDKQSSLPTIINEGLCLVLWEYVFNFKSALPETAKNGPKNKENCLTGNHFLTINSLRWVQLLVSVSFTIVGNGIFCPVNVSQNWGQIKSVLVGDLSGSIRGSLIF